MRSEPVAVKTLEEATRAKEQIEAEILGKPGVTGIDSGLRPGGNEPVIRVYVSDQRKAPPLPVEVDGVPVIVIERRFELH